MAENNILWSDRKRWGFLGLPFTFTVYSLAKDKLTIKTGFFNLRTDEVRLYRIMDMSLVQSLGQRLFGLGTIKVDSKDKTLGNFEIKNVKNAGDVYELLSQTVEDERVSKRVSAREFMVDVPDGEPDDDPDDDSDDDDDDNDNN